MSETKNYKSIIESLIFASDKPLNIKEIAGSVGIMASEVQKYLKEITEDFKEKGIRLINKDEHYHFSTAPENADSVAALLNEELRHDISAAGLETLAIIAYKQPITKSEIEDIRGVNSDQMVRNLLIRGLIEEVGRRETVGKPILYGTSFEFIKYLGLENEQGLPNIEMFKETVVQGETS